MAKGQGVNSIPVRFALLTATLMTLLAAGHAALWVTGGYHYASDTLMLAASLCVIALPTAATWLAARKLTGQIIALKRSTEAIVAGDFDVPVEVDCACEVGGLADSFRKMVSRLNSNIVRMNVLAYTDPVTSLPNRSVITHMLGHFTARARPGAGTLMFIDLDGFKRINDTLGHGVGDELLKAVSLRIIAGLGRTPDEMDTCTTPFGELCNRPPDNLVLVRFAGDEFVVLAPGVVEEEDAARLAQGVLHELAAPFDIDGNEVKIGASIGLARAPIDSADPQELLAFADLAMYAAKESGRNRCVFFNPALRQLANENSHIEAALRQALAQGTLVLHFQPKLDARTLDCVGYEALARWRHPELGWISPARFVPIAEQAGLMRALGARVLEMAARQVRAWIDEGRPRRVSVNVSPIQFDSPDFVSETLALLERHGAPPRSIELEVTESLIMCDFASASLRMRQLQAAGVSISIDDFGIGFSNLSQLARLQFDTLKIDRSLVADIGVNPRSESIVKAIVDMAHALGHHIVAEGIETPQQFAFLRAANCDRMQGFLFGRPMPAEEIETWERDRARVGARRAQDDLEARIALAD